MWANYVRPGYYHYLGNDFSFSNGGGYFGSDGGVGTAGFDPIYVPPGKTWTITKAGVYNADTVSDATLSIRVGLYSVATDGSLALVQDFGTIGKDTTATTTIRQVGSNVSVVLTGNTLYATVAMEEAVRAGASLGFQSQLQNTYFGSVYGAKGDNSTSDAAAARGGSGGIVWGWKSLTTGSMPATLAIPTPINYRPAVVFYYVSTEA